MVQSLLWDAFLVAGFGIQHSLLATIRAKKVVKVFSKLDPLTWRGPQSFFNVLYVVVAASLWQPVDYVVWEFTGVTYWLVASVLAAGWLWYFQIHIFEYDCGLAFGSTAAVNSFQGRENPNLEMWKTGFRRWSRFPVHTAFFPMFLAFPTMRADLLVLGVVAIAYNVVGTILYDVRLKTLVGEPYQKYVDQTGLMFPPVYRNLKGARDMELPEPYHWMQPSQNLTGIFLGVLGGVFYWRMMGQLELTPGNMFISWGLSFVLAIVGGFLLGFMRRTRLNVLDWDRFQTEISTNSALMSAIALLTWFVISLAKVDAHPTLAAVLPMWITVLWVGHVSAATISALPMKYSSTVPEVTD